MSEIRTKAFGFWTENSRLDEYYRDPNIFRLIHRGDIRPFYTRQVSVKHCKPFKGKIDSEEIIDPIMLDRFLNAMGVDSQDELISEIDSHQPRRGGAGAGSDSDDDPGPGPVRGGRAGGGGGRRGRVGIHPPTPLFVI